MKVNMIDSNQLQTVLLLDHPTTEPVWDTCLGFKYMPILDIGRRYVRHDSTMILITLENKNMAIIQYSIQQLSISLIRFLNMVPWNRNMWENLILSQLRHKIKHILKVIS